ncbi:MAG TPA: 8-amino-7-oxononanoate synthase [Verrucomicrobiae bacterium]|nr:8-amino-7-oxononanoate synthase [Verrucomicrobiae bacterium]
MSLFDQELKARLNAIREQGLHRELRRVDSAQGPRIRIDGRELLNFSSNDYLGLANHPALKEAAIKATKDFGAGAGASRLICGSLAPFHELEEMLATFKGTEAALTFSTGYATAVGTITALLGKDDIIIVDKLVHACIVDAAKLSGAKLRVFAHNDPDDLEDKLRWADAQSRHPSPVTHHILVVTESIFSMDGDAAPLKEIIALKEKYGAWLMVDEAHATGLYGQNRRGLAEELGVSNRIEIQMGTLGKALGASGGYICGSRVLIDLLINRARSFIFSTAPVPAAAGAAAAAIELVQSAEGQRRCEALGRRVQQCRTGVAPVSNISRPAQAEPDIRDRRDACPTPIIPIIIGAESTAVSAATKLREQGIFVPAIRYPTVARGSARLRVTLTASHSTDDVAALAGALSEIRNRKS